MATGIAGLLSLIASKILSGGRRTTADNSRDVYEEIVNSNLNTVDGGVVSGPVELEGDLIKTDDKNVRRVIKISESGELYTEVI
jgi:hypothetical protein